MRLTLKKLFHTISIIIIIAISISYVNADEFFFDFENPKEEVYSPTKIKWDAGTLQIYDGTSVDPVYQFIESESPVIVDLKNGYYEFKRWKDGGSEAFNVNILEPVDENGAQLDENAWVTVPGDGCKPVITDVEELYDKYGPYVEIDNEDNPLQTILIADGKKHMDDNSATMSPPFIMHNITYLRKYVPSSLEGLHVASYIFRIPSFSTGITTEGGLFVWSHLNQKNYGLAFQLIVDETDPDFSKFFYYGETGGWVDSSHALNLQTDTFYEIKFILDVKNRLADMIITDTGSNTTFQINDVFSETSKNGWSTTSTLAHLQAECISKDGVRHSVIFKDYSWCYDADMDNSITDICDDDCPVDPEKTEPGRCGCGRYEPDFNADDIIDLKDVIIVLQVLTDKKDLNLNSELVDKIGMPEAIYTLQCLANPF